MDYPLCLDFTLFTSKDFTNKLELKIGKFAFKLLQNILLSQIESNINNNLSLDNINDVTFLEKPYIQQTIETYNIIPFPSLSDFKILGINAHKNIFNINIREGIIIVKYLKSLT